MRILIFIFLTILSSIFYRLGGIGKPYPVKIRDGGCPLVALTLLWLLGSSGLQGVFLLKIGLFLVTYGLMFASLTTYWKKGVDAKAINWFFHGFGVGISCLPLTWLGIDWWLILARAVILGITMMWWSENNDDVLWEEGGRGALIILTLPVLLT